MTQTTTNPIPLTSTALLLSPQSVLSVPSLFANAGNVFCMTVDPFHSHEHSSSLSSVATIATAIDEIALADKLNKNKTIFKPNRKKIPANWTKHEVKQLVALMEKHGSDFTLIATQMNKTRDQIKRKFKVLERQQPDLADAIFFNKGKSEKTAVSQEWTEEDDFLAE